jgi:dUTP pyrophosphatase
MSMLIKTTKALSKAHKWDAGFDVEAEQEVVIPAGESRLIGTGLHLEIPEGWVGVLKSRSGLSVKFNLEVGAGVIDCGYIGHVKVHLYNHGTNDYKVMEGDRIAQMLFVPVPEIDWLVVSALDETDRGENGFGSSGV